MNKKYIPLFKMCIIILSADLRGKGNFPNGINFIPKWAINNVYYVHYIEYSSFREWHKIHVFPN